MNIEISTEQLNSDIAKMQERLDNLVAAKDQVYRCLENLNGMWEGAAQMTFTLQTRMDYMFFQGLISNLNNLIECMEYAKSEYEKCNSEVNDKIASIRLSGDT